MGNCKMSGNILLVVDFSIHFFSRYLGQNSAENKIKVRKKISKNYTRKKVIEKRQL